MSIVLFGGGGGSSSVPTATETVQGKAQIATSAQVTTGTESGAYFVTPVRLQAKIDAALTSTLEYKGSYNNSTTSPDLTTATKGDLYIVDNAGGGTLAGVSISVGDHIVFNQNSASPLQSSYFDVIVSADAVQSVNGRTGVVTGLLDASSNLLDLTNATTARTNLGCGTAATSDSTDFLTVANNLNDLNNKATARTNLGVAIGSDVQAYNANLTAIAAATISDGNFLVSTGSQWVVESGLTARTSIGCGTIATQASDSVSITGGAISGITDLAVADGGTGASNASDARTNLGVAIGSNVQAYNANLTAIAAATISDGNFLVSTGSQWVVESGLTARTSIGCGTIATQASDSVSITGGAISGITDLAVADGGTGASNASDARTNLGCGTSASLDVGTSANQVVQLDGSARLPAVDGSQLTNLPSGGSRPTVTEYTGATVDLTSAPAATVLEVIAVCNASSGTQTVNLHTAVGHEGLKYQIKRTGAANVTVTPNGSEHIDHSGQTTFVLSTQYSNLTIVSDNANWLII